MKRQGNLFGHICSLENLRTAAAIARRGKEHQYGVSVFDRNPEVLLTELRDMLWYKEYTTSEYSHITIKDPKEREISRLPFYPDRIVQHAIMNVIQPFFVTNFTADTYSCIKGRGVHGFDRKLKQALQDVPGTQYCLKIDIRKFYHSIDHDVIKKQLRRKFKDPDLLWLLDDIVDSAPGVPIGNYLSQFYANFNLSPFDHWLKEVVKVKHYFRYSDDMVILADNKPYLHQMLAMIRDYLKTNLQLTLKDNYQVFPVADRGIDVVGYVYYHGYSRLRKSIKKKFARAIAKKKSVSTIAAYWGWAKHCNSSNLMKKLFPQPKLIAA